LIVDRALAEIYCKVKGNYAVEKVLTYSKHTEVSRTVEAEAFSFLGSAS